MKKLCLTVSVMLSVLLSVAQQNPVRWNYSTKKIAHRTFEIRISAILDNGWHIYSQWQPKDAVALPTTIHFTPNPLLKLIGKPKEIGKLEKKFEPVLELEQYQFSTKVDFVQLIEVKSNAQINLLGNITYMACTDERCLPEAKVPFKVNIHPGTAE